MFGTISGFIERLLKILKDSWVFERLLKILKDFWSGS